MAKKKKDDEEAQPESSDGSIAVNDAWTGMLAVSLLALAVGSGFLAYDWMQYSDGDPPKVSKFTSAPPGAPVKAPPPKAEPKVEPKDGAVPKDGGDKKDADKKDADKKDG